MIFVTVGTQKFQFDRLLKKLDVYKSETNEDHELIAQIGYSNYKPNNYEFVDFLPPKKLLQYIQQSEMVITHAGTSSIIQALKMEKKVLVVPRQKKYGEHVDNHQIEICKAFSSENYIEDVYNINDLAEKINKAKNKEYNKYTFDNSELLYSIEMFLLNLTNNDIKK